MRKPSLVLILLFSFFIFPGKTLWAQDSGRQIPLDLPTRKIEDDSSLRISLEASWFRESPGMVRSRRPEIHNLKGGGRVQVRFESSSQNRDEFAVVLAREQNGAYPGWAQGSWVLIRRWDNDSRLSKIRVFLRSDFNTYVQFRPFTDEKCQMDVVLYDAYVIRGLPIPIPFERLFVLPVEEVLAAAGEKFPRRYFDPEPGLYRDSRAFIAAVRARLPGLVFADDGAINKNGEYVFIETLDVQNTDTPESGGLNCSGFSKWVVDGLVKPLAGERLPVAPLKLPFEDRDSLVTKTPGQNRTRFSMGRFAVSLPGGFPDPGEEFRDEFFGLDWCRNLASSAGQIMLSPSFGSLEEIEVRDWPFSQVILRRPGGRSDYLYPGYLVNAGFGVEGLHPLLYTLAINEPNRIYLAAVNKEEGAPVTPDNPRGLPRLRRYYHIAVLVPYFAANGTFQVAVFESAAETSFTGFKNRYPGQFVNLSRIPVDGVFEP